MASILEIASKLKKEYKDENLILKSDIVPTYQRLRTGALGLDYVLGGGLPYGRIAQVSGQPHSGKTTGACCFLAAYQRENPTKTCVYVDVEHSLDLQHQTIMNGIDLKKLYYVNPVGLSGEQIIDMIVELQKSDDIGMIVLDSIAAMTPQIVLENDLVEDKGIRATMAKKMYQFLNIMSSMLQEKNNILLLINQVRDGGKTFTGAQIWKEPCNGASSFASSVSIRFGTRTFTKGDEMDACKPDGEGADGFRLKFKIMKNKTAPCNRGGGFITYRYGKGLDWMHDLLEIALTFNFINRVNNVTYELIDLKTGEIYKDKDGKLLRGKKADLMLYIQNNIDFQRRYLDMLQTYISLDNTKTYGQLLDERASHEIDEEETGVVVED